MIDYPTLAAIIVPISSWALYVESRLGKLEAIKEKVEAVDAKVERLVDHFLPTILPKPDRI